MTFTGSWTYPTKKKSKIKKMADFQKKILVFVYFSALKSAIKKNNNNSHLRLGSGSPKFNQL